MTTFIYVLIDPRQDVWKAYVGKSNDPVIRFKEHKAEANTGKVTKKCNWLRKLISLSLEPELLILDEVHETDWCFWEKYYIYLFDSWKYDLTNVRSGGSGITVHSDDTRYKIARALVGKKRGPRPTEVKLKISKSHIGIGLGSNRTLEEKAKISMGLKIAYSEGRRSASWSGKQLSPAHNQKIRAALKKPVYQYDKAGNFLKEWPSATDIGIELGYNPSSIGQCCRGTLRSSKGFIWKYK